MKQYGKLILGGILAIAVAALIAWPLGAYDENNTCNEAARQGNSKCMFDDVEVQLFLEGIMIPTAIFGVSLIVGTAGLAVTNAIRGKDRRLRRTKSVRRLMDITALSYVVALGLGVILIQHNSDAVAFVYFLLAFVVLGAPVTMAVAVILNSMITGK